jgi:hypothetical protein
MKKNKENIEKNNKVYRAVRVDTETDAMISEVASAENRNFSNSIIRLARIGHRYWKKNAQKITCI